MIAVVILPAESTGIRQRSSSDEIAEIDTPLQPLHHDRQEPIGRRLLHQGHEWLHRPEPQVAVRAVRQGRRRQAQILSQGRANESRPACLGPHWRETHGGDGDPWSVSSGGTPDVMVHVVC